MKRSTLGLLALLLAASACDAQSESLPPADELVRRNVFRGATEFAIVDARAFQYGSVHVDGPEGGMLFRFETDARGLDWLVRAWALDSIRGDSAPALPPIDDAPRWWRTAERASATPLAADSTDVWGGVRTVLLHRVPGASTVYWREHYRASPRAPRP